MWDTSPFEVLTAPASDFVHAFFPMALPSVLPAFALGLRITRLFVSRVPDVCLWIARLVPVGALACGAWLLVPAAADFSNLNNVWFWISWVGWLISAVLLSIFFVATREGTDAAAVTQAAMVFGYFPAVCLAVSDTPLSALDVGAYIAMLVTLGYVVEAVLFLVTRRSVSLPSAERPQQ